MLKKNTESEKQFEKCKIYSSRTVRVDIQILLEMSIDQVAGCQVVIQGFIYDAQKV